MALLLALAVLLREVDANARNPIVKGIHEGANFFAEACTGMIVFRGHPKREITVDRVSRSSFICLSGHPIAPVERAPSSPMVD
jgi:hypothetical protein